MDIGPNKLWNGIWELLKGFNGNLTGSYTRHDGIEICPLLWGCCDQSGTNCLWTNERKQPRLILSWGTLLFVLAIYKLKRQFHMDLHTLKIWLAPMADTLAGHTHTSN